LRFVAIFLFFVAVLAVAIAETRGRTSPLHRLKSESTCLSKKKIAENAASRPNFGDFFGRRAPPPAPPAGFRRILRILGGGGETGRGSPGAGPRESRSSSWDLRRGEVVVMVVVVVRAGDGAASAVSADRERDVPRPRPRAAPPPRGRRVRASRSVPPAFSWSARRAQVYVYSERR